MNKKARTQSQDGGEDRLSSLPDEVLHQILSHVGTRLAVQTSMLSNRWKVLWTTLPFLNFDLYDQLFPFTHSTIIDFIHHVFTDRDHQTNIVSLKFKAVYPMPRSLMVKLINYAILHNVQDLDIDLSIYYHCPYFLSTFSSHSIQKLKLGVCLHFDKFLKSDCCWDLPALTTLHLISSPPLSTKRILISCLMCLPSLTTLCLNGFKLMEASSSSSLFALTTLCLDNCIFPKSSLSFNLPFLTTLTIRKCKFPQTICDFPALLNLELDDVLFPENMSDFFHKLVNLRNLTLSFPNRYIQDCFISCPQLVSITISTSVLTCISDTRKIVVSAPKLRKLYSIGIFPVTLEVHELEKVYIKFWDTNDYKNVAMSYVDRFLHFFDEVGSAKVLTLDSPPTVEALSTISYLLYCCHPSPFHNLEYLKLPKGYTESSLPTTLKNYLLGVPRRATVITTLPENNMESSSSA